MSVLNTVWCTVPYGMIVSTTPYNSEMYNSEMSVLNTVGCTVPFGMIVSTILLVFQNYKCIQSRVFQNYKCIQSRVFHNYKVYSISLTYQS